MDQREQKTDTDLPTAFHEAAHAVVLAQAGLDFECVTIEPGRGTVGSLKCPRRHEEVDVETYSPTFNDDEYNAGEAARLARIEAHAISDFAGQAAEKRLTGEPHPDGAGGDEADAEDLADKAVYILEDLPGHTPEDAASFLARMRLAADTFVQDEDNWRSIRVVAEALITCQTLTLEAVRTILAAPRL